MDLQNEKCVMVIDLQKPPPELPFGCMATKICRLALSQIRRLSWELPWEKRCRRWSVQVLQIKVETNISALLNFPYQF